MSRNGQKGSVCDPRSVPDADPQWERANQVWSLHLRVDAGQLSKEAQRALFRILRVKRMERSAFLERLPGTIRRGARVDLEPVEAALREAGFDCELRRSSDPSPT